MMDMWRGMNYFVVDKMDMLIAMLILMVVCMPVLVGMIILLTLPKSMSLETLELSSQIQFTDQLEAPGSR